MRRKDREVTERGEVLAMLSKAEVIRLGLSDNGMPYIVPMNFAWEEVGGKLYIYLHCAKEGKRIDILSRNNKVCIEVDGKFEVLPAEQPCGYSAIFESAIGFGTGEILEDKGEKTHALEQLMIRYQFPHKPVFNDAALGSVAVIRLTIEELTGKARTE